MPFPRVQILFVTSARLVSQFREVFDWLRDDDDDGWMDGWTDGWMDGWMGIAITMIRVPKTNLHFALHWFTWMA